MSYEQRPAVDERERLAEEAAGYLDIAQRDVMGASEFDREQEEIHPDIFVSTSVNTADLGEFARYGEVLLDLAVQARTRAGSAEVVVPKPPKAITRLITTYTEIDEIAPPQQEDKEFEALAADPSTLPTDSADLHLLLGRLDRSRPSRFSREDYNAMLSMATIKLMRVLSHLDAQGGAATQVNPKTSLAIIAALPPAQRAISLVCSSVARNDGGAELMETLRELLSGNRRTPEATDSIVRYMTTEIRSANALAQWLESADAVLHMYGFVTVQALNQAARSTSQLNQILRLAAQDLDAHTNADLVDAETAAATGSRAIADQARAISRQAAGLIQRTLTSDPLLRVSLIEVTPTPLHDRLEEEAERERARIAAAQYTAQLVIQDQMKAELEGFTAEHLMSRRELRRNHPTDGTKLTGRLIAGEITSRDGKHITLSTKLALDIAGMAYKLGERLDERGVGEVFDDLLAAIEREAEVGDQINQPTHERRLSVTYRWLIDNLDQIRKSDVVVLKRVGDALEKYRAASPDQEEAGI